MKCLLGLFVMHVLKCLLELFVMQVVKQHGVWQQVLA